MDSNKPSLARSRSQPFRSSFNLPIAAAASTQHRQNTGYPMNASVADSQSWRSNLKVSGIVVSSSGPQFSSASLDVRKCTSVTSTHTGINNYVMTPRRAMDAVKWHSTQMAVAVSHRYTSLENMIVLMLPSLKPDFVWILADDLYIVHNGLLPSIQGPIHWHQHGHDIQVSGKAVQAVQTLSNDLRMQTRSLAEWKSTGKIVLQTCQHISLALIGLLLPCAVTLAIQASRVMALISTTLLHLTMQQTNAVARKRMQCSTLYHLHKIVYYANSTFKQTNGSIQFLILCDALMLRLFPGVDVREVHLYMNATAVACIAGLMIGVLILHLMSTYENLLRHTAWNNRPTQLRKFDHPKCANGKYWSRVRYLQERFVKHKAEHSELAASKQRVCENNHL